VNHYWLDVFNMPNLLKLKNNSTKTGTV